jgi:hypothetical protein
MAIDEETWASRLVDAACHVVGSKRDVKSITVVENQRLPYDDLARLRASADSCDADFVMEGDGTVVVQRKAPATTTNAPPPESDAQMDVDAASSDSASKLGKKNRNVLNAP